MCLCTRSVFSAVPSGRQHRAPSCKQLYSGRATSKTPSLEWLPQATGSSHFKQSADGGHILMNIFPPAYLLAESC